MTQIEHNGIAITADILPKKKKVSLLVGTSFCAVQVGTFDSPEKAAYFMRKLCDMVVHCGECKYMQPDGRCSQFADDKIRPSASDYCSAGVRKEV